MSKLHKVVTMSLELSSPPVEGFEPESRGTSINSSEKARRQEEAD